MKLFWSISKNGGFGGYNPLLARILPKEWGYPLSPSCSGSIVWDEPGFTKQKKVLQFQEKVLVCHFMIALCIGFNRSGSGIGSREGSGMLQGKIFELRVFSVVLSLCGILIFILLVCIFHAHALQSQGCCILGRSLEYCISLEYIVKEVWVSF